MDKTYDVIIIGGGAAGMMAAISARRHHPEYSVAIVDRTFALGRKILVCGAGRCNITNINLNADAVGHYYGAKPEFISAIFEQMAYEDIVRFFADLGIEVYVERKTNIGKVFPVTNQAQTVTELLLDELKRLKVDIYLNTECEKLEIRNSKSETNGSDSDFKFQIHAQELENNIPTGKLLNLKSKFLILSAGGKTYPALGSNGTGYALAESLGHHIIQPVPSALPLEGKNALSQQLQGVKMEMEVTSYIDDQKVKTAEEDVMFTQYGLSGPAILNISREISIHINREGKRGAYVTLNFFPGKNADVVKNLLKQRWSKRPDQTLEKSLFGIFPNKIPSALLKVMGMDPSIAVQNLTETQIDQLVQKLTSYRVDITGTRGWNEAEFTAGGIDTMEVNQGTLQSKVVPGLYLCGEILDVDGDVGGFNLSWAWSSGFVVGKLA
jgi:predicted Rossmann fold flavoprotein